MRFEPGDWVEALQSDCCWPKCRIVKGRLYQVAEVDDEFGLNAACSACGSDCQHQAVELVGQAMPSHLRWCGSSFRLVYRPKQSWILGVVLSESRRQSAKP